MTKGMEEYRQEVEEYGKQTYAALEKQILGEPLTEEEKRLLKEYDAWRERTLRAKMAQTQKMDEEAERANKTYDAIGKRILGEPLTEEEKALLEEYDRDHAQGLQAKARRWREWDEAQECEDRTYAAIGKQILGTPLTDEEKELLAEYDAEHAPRLEAKNAMWRRWDQERAAASESEIHE